MHACILVGPDFLGFESKNIDLPACLLLVHHPPFKIICIIFSLFTIHHHSSNMSSIVCLGQFMVPFQLMNPQTTQVSPAVLQRGDRRIHIFTSPGHHAGGLPNAEAASLSSLFKHKGDSINPLAEEDLTQPSHTVFINSYVVVQNNNQAELWGCLFCREDFQQNVLEVFGRARINICQIINYDKDHFFGVNHVNSTWLVGVSQKEVGEICGCQTSLKDHQIEGLQFLLANEEDEDKVVLGLWNHADNQWIRAFCCAENSNIKIRSLDFKCWGSILADDMGLGKTLTTLVLIQKTGGKAIQFRNSSPVRSSATLIICPVATLTNWENEINTHFELNSLPYVTFHGKRTTTMEKDQLVNTAIVLTTYETVNPVGPPKNRRVKSVDLKDIEWFRIVVDEAQ